MSDLHLDAVTAGKPRRREVIEYLVDAADVVKQKGVDLVLFGGDAFDPGSLSEALYATDLLHAFAAFVRAGAHVVAIAGNHDVVDTSELVDNAPVTTLTSVRAAFNLIGGALPRNVLVCQKPTFVHVSSDWGVLALPYLARAHAGRAADWTDRAFDEAATFRKSGRIVVLAHLVVPGATLGSESSEMARGQGQIFPFERVKALGASLVINGHYHARQEVLGEHDVPIQVPGSPVRFTFGEVDDHLKGFLLASFS